MNTPGKTDKPRQLPLDLALEPLYGPEDFLVGPSNEAAYDLLMRWPDWPAPMLLLVGPKGCGKTHLAHIWAEQAQAKVIPAKRLNDVDPVMLAATPALVVEDCDSGDVDDTVLFHLFNSAREQANWLVFTAQRHPSQWPINTPDLISRLRLLPVTEITAPDDALLRALIVKQFLDRQIIVDISVVEYLLPRIERTFAEVARVVDALDQEALALGRRITRPIATKVIGAAGMPKGKDTDAPS